MNVFDLTDDEVRHLMERFKEIEAKDYEEQLDYQKRMEQEAHDAKHCGDCGSYLSVKERKSPYLHKHFCSGVKNG